MAVPALINWQLLPSKRPSGTSGSAGSGLKLGEIVSVMKVPACRTLTIFMLFTGLGGQM